MSEELKEAVEESTVDQPIEEVVDQEKPVEEKPVEEKFKNEVDEDGTIKLDLTNLNKIPNPPDATEEEKVVEEQVEEVVENVVEETQEEQPALEEITNEEVQEQTEQLTEDIVEAVTEAKESGVELPENIQKAVDFMNDTGGSLEDYVKLNQDFSSLQDDQLLKEFYKQTKPHLSNDEIDFMIDDSFSFDEDEDTEREVKRKKLALKEQVASAKSHLDGQKSKYYEEIKAGSRLAPEQKKAIDFFNRYEVESEENNKVLQSQKSIFDQKTEQVFSNEFKGFEYNVGEKKYRFNVKDAKSVKNTQSDINNFVKKFLNDKNQMNDAKGYHKSLFTAMNPDMVANHFYEQGKTDAMKDSMVRSKNISMEPRKGHENVIKSGFSVRAVPSESSNDYKIKIRK
tara:strand:+ start:2134 stop:3327 length:1194 start_codon:yes stop_codon:yes gene_type:complete